MLTIVVPERELYMSESNTFITVREHKLKLEHSLMSIYKWESKWHKSFINTTDKSVDETVHYVKCMTITQNVDPLVYKCLTVENFRLINDYINDPMTATTFSDDHNQKKNRKIITAEVIYARMLMAGIPLECEKWHLNKLLTLLRVCESYQSPPKKMNRNEMISQRKALNAARRKKYNSKG